MQVGDELLPRDPPAAQIQVFETAANDRIGIHDLALECPGQIEQIAPFAALVEGAELRGAEFVGLVGNDVMR